MRYDAHNFSVCVVRFTFLTEYFPVGDRHVRCARIYKYQPVIVSVSSRRRAQTECDIQIIGANKDPEIMRLLVLSVCLLATFVSSRRKSTVLRDLIFLSYVYSLSFVADYSNILLLFLIFYFFFINLHLLHYMVI